jgi:hypothetical protein
VSIKYHAILALMTSFKLCTDHMSCFMGPGKPKVCALTTCQVLWDPVNLVGFVTTLLSRISLLHVVAFLFGGGMKHQDDGRAGYHWEPRLHHWKRGPGSA